MPRLTKKVYYGPKPLAKNQKRATQNQAIKSKQVRYWGTHLANRYTDPSLTKENLVRKKRSSKNEELLRATHGDVFREEEQAQEILPEQVQEVEPEEPQYQLDEKIANIIYYIEGSERYKELRESQRTKLIEMLIGDARLYNIFSVTDDLYEAVKTYNEIEGEDLDEEERKKYWDQFQNIKEEFSNMVKSLLSINESYYEKRIIEILNLFKNTDIDNMIRNVISFIEEAGPEARIEEAGEEEGVEEGIEEV